ncbi:unnamed protein product [Phaedon cochleariae]|uniref:DUF4806 domain-containing protein n=1 Tax=Phaedon cochleariae TaxID=80249 RepID=A0A9N9SK94_PHACE|nr:unnamed protein product [Phaedon cochleariae]
MWTVVIFVEENSIETVPLKWLIGTEENLSYWPAVKGIKLNSMIVNCAEPTRDWEIFEIRFPNNNKKTYDNFLKARMACSRMAEDSDVLSEGDSLKRSRKPKKIYSSDEEEGCSQSRLPHPPALPDKSFVPPLKSSCSGLDVHVDDDVDISCPSTTSSMCSVEIIDHLSDVDSISMDNMGKENAESTPSICRTVKQVHGTPKNVNHKQLNQSDNRILRQLVVLNHKVDMLSSDITKILEKMTTDNTLIPDEDVEMENYFPIKTDEELNNFELYLFNDRNHQKFTQYVTKLGGSTLSEAVRRAMERTVKDELIQQFSWMGQKQKNKFGDLKIAQAMKDGIKRNVILKDSVTEASIESCMKNWMRHAKDRLQKRAKKATTIDR